MIDIYRNSIFLVFIIFLLVLAIYKKSKKEGFYLSFFPVCKNEQRGSVMDTKNPQANTVEFKDSVINFKFPKETSREQMISYIGNFFKSKINGVYKNTLLIKFERKGIEDSEFYPINKINISDKDFHQVNLVIGYNDLNVSKYSNYGIAQRTKYITTPQVNRFIKYPLEFNENSVRIMIYKSTTPIPILYFMHYYFDDFYCKGKMESKNFNVSGTALNNSSVSRYVVEVGNLQDCKWGSDNSKVQNCKLFEDKELIPDDISVEPDNIISGYQTPSKKLNRCNVKQVYFKKWDARGVPIENLEEDVKMKEFIPHPALFQNKLDGLYDDIFDMSRIIPSFPTGRMSVGR
jgi:hypothetical protein